MSKTVILEQLPPDAQRVIEELLSSDEPVVIAREGRMLGGMIGYESQAAELTPEEESDIKTAIAQGEADYAAGRHLTLDEFKVKYADKLQEDEK